MTADPPSLSRAAVLDLDEDTTTLVDGASRQTWPTPGPPGATDRPTVLVRTPHGPSPEQLESRYRTTHRSVYGVGRFAACVAAAARRGVTGDIEICDLSWTSTRLARAGTDGTQITVGAHREVPELSGDAFTDGLVTDSAARTGVRDALTTDTAFLVEACEQAATDPVFRDVQVVAVAGTAITAGALLDALAAFRKGLGPLLAAPGEAAHTMLAGAFAAFPPLARIVAEETGRMPLVVPGAVVEGALLLAAGAYTGPDGPRASVRLPLHRREAGLPVDLLVALPHDVGEYASLDGTDLYVAKGGATDGLPLGNALQLHVDGTPLEVDVADVPAGRYRLGVRHAPGGGPLLALAGDGATAPVLLPLTERSARR
ncbi:hypothetical protein [Actinomadura fibrosa]|uniref:Uncharacterized protein n=1 Tax=Actinomadura fibrosa TaxID=111802 RepID=A0ABW2XDX9_9ACTN|nr:hypothetical protein [Actinomadura fibrosa]